MKTKKKLLQLTLNRQLALLDPFEVYAKPNCGYHYVVNKFCTIPEKFG